MAKSDPVFGRLNSLIGLLGDEDDRGLVLSMAAFAEDILGRLIRAFLLDVKAAEEIVSGFNAPLGTLSARIKACHALGLLSDEQFSDLEHLRKIRNEFAHNWDGCSFSNPMITRHIQQMNESRLDGSQKTSAAKIRSSICCILVELESNINQMAKKSGRLRASWGHLSFAPPK